MHDIEKVIKGLACCRDSMNDNPLARCEECPYNDEGFSVQECRSVLCADALEAIQLDKLYYATLLLDMSKLADELLNNGETGICAGCGKWKSGLAVRSWPREERYYAGWLCEDCRKEMGTDD